MTRAFVAIDDSVHGLLRELTRATPLCWSSEAVPGLGYRVSEGRLPDAYYSLAMLHAIGGMPLECMTQTRWKISVHDREGVPEQVNLFDATRLDWRCARDLRLVSPHGAPGLYSAELLAFGVGALRALNDDAGDPLQRYLGWQHEPLLCRGQVVYARIGALHKRENGAIGKESYASTNLICGDCLGELEQLWERRADTTFLETVLASLEGLRREGRVACRLQPPLRPRDVVQLHLERQAIWKAPPKSARALLHRLDYILSNTRLETPIRTAAAPAGPASGQTRDGADSKPGDWRHDRTGYEGWI